MEGIILDSLKIIGLAILQMWWLIVPPIVGTLLFYYKYLKIRSKGDRSYRIKNDKNRSKKKAHIAKYAEYRKAM